MNELKKLQKELEQQALYLRCADCLDEVLTCKASIKDIVAKMEKLKRESFE